MIYRFALLFVTLILSCNPLWAASRPNIIYLLADDLDTTEIGAKMRALQATGVPDWQAPD